MSICLFIILTGLCLASLIHYLRIKGGVYEYPFLTILVIGGFILPQFYGMLNIDFPGNALSKSFFVVITCTCGLIFGYELGKRRKKIIQIIYEYDERRLTYAAAFLTVLGSIFFVKISRLPDEMLFGTWSGRVVAYRFFAFSVVYGLVMALILFLRNKSCLALSLALIGAFFLFDRIVMAGRRSTTAQLPLIFLTCLWFVRRWQVPRPIFLIGAVIGFILISFLVQYRGISTKGTGYASLLQGSRPPSIEEIEEINPLKNIGSVLQESGAEVELLIYSVYATSLSESYDFGLYHWNGLVYNFVPAQILGRAFKQSLMIGNPLAKFRSIGYEKKSSTAMTGFADAYGSFWYFGCLKFFIIAYIMGGLYHKAMNGHLRSQIYYVCLLLSALHAVPHSTQQFLREAIMLLIFTYPLFWLCRKKSQVDEMHLECWPNPNFLRGTYYHGVRT